MLYYANTDKETTMKQITKTNTFGKILTTGILSLFLSAPASAERVLNLYNWTDYIGETTIADFEKETGIKVVYDNYDAAETVDAKLLAGSSGYDLVLHAGFYISRLIQAGVLAEIDTSKIPNYGNYDPDILKKVETYDPGNKHSVPYLWGTVGVTYNLDMIRERIPNAPLNSLDMLFKPEYAAKLADCGISVLESPREVIPMGLAYLGLDPNSMSKDDYEKVVELFKPVRQYIKAFDASNYLNALPNKELCMVFNWSGDYATATSRAAEAGVDINLAYYIPETGSPAFFDVWVMPKDAKNREEAFLFLDYMSRPEVIAAATNYVYYANANSAANEFVSDDILSDTAIYPDRETLKTLWTTGTLKPKAERAHTRAWTKIKTGQ